MLVWDESNKILGFSAEPESRSLMMVTSSTEPDGQHKGFQRIGRLGSDDKYTLSSLESQFTSPDMSATPHKPCLFALDQDLCTISPLAPSSESGARSKMGVWTVPKRGVGSIAKSHFHGAFALGGACSEVTDVKHCGTAIVVTLGSSAISFHKRIRS